MMSGLSVRHAALAHTRAGRCGRGYGDAAKVEQPSDSHPAHEERFCQVQPENLYLPLPCVCRVLREEGGERQFERDEESTGVSRKTVVTEREESVRTAETGRTRSDRERRERTEEMGREG